MDYGEVVLKAMVSYSTFIYEIYNTQDKYVFVGLSSPANKLCNISDWIKYVLKI